MCIHSVFPYVTMERPDLLICSRSCSPSRPTATTGALCRIPLWLPEDKLDIVGLDCAGNGSNHGDRISCYWDVKQKGADAAGWGLMVTLHPNGKNGFGFIQFTYRHLTFSHHFLVICALDGYQKSSIHPLALHLKNHANENCVSNLWHFCDDGGHVLRSLA